MTAPLSYQRSSVTTYMGIDVVKLVSFYSPLTQSERSWVQTPRPTKSFSQKNVLKLNVNFHVISSFM